MLAEARQCRHPLIGEEANLTTLQIHLVRSSQRINWVNFKSSQRGIEEELSKQQQQRRTNPSVEVRAKSHGPVGHDARVSHRKRIACQWGVDAEKCSKFVFIESYCWWVLNRFVILISWMHYSFCGADGQIMGGIVTI